MTLSADETRTAWICLAFIAAWQMFCWVLAPVLTNDAPPLDVVENTVWGTARVIATYKNPALASLLLEGARVVTGGAIGWPAYVLSQIAVGFTFLFVFLLGEAPLGPRPALIGTLLLTACYYFGWHTPEFNQDIVQMPFWAGVALALWRAIDTDRWDWWALLGFFSAGAMYGKLSAALLLITAALWLLIDARGRKRLTTSFGPWLAYSVFLVLMIPLTRWLANGGLGLISDYAVHRGKFSALAFPGIQILVTLPMVAVLAMAGILDRATLPAAAARFKNAARNWSDDRSPETEKRRFIRYLVWMTLAPIALSLLAVTLANTGTKLMWGVPMLSLTGLLYVALADRAITDRALRITIILAMLLIALNATGMAMTTRFGNQFRNVADRQNWPQQEIAQRLRGIWAGETNSAALTIVAGDATNWTSGLVALGGGDIPLVYTAANTRLAPWVTPAQVARDGALVVWQDKGYGFPSQLKKLIAGRAPRFETFPLRHPGKVRELTIGYVVVPPRS